MGRSFVLDSYADGALQDIAHVDEDGFTYETVQHNEQDILSLNDSIRNARGKEITKVDGGLHHVAQIPIEVWNRWCREHPVLRHGPKHERDKTLAMLINSRDYNRVRTSEASKF